MKRVDRGGRSATRASRSRKAGLPPGTAVYTGGRIAAPLEIEAFDYDQSRFEQRKFNSITDCGEFRDSPTPTWFRVTGLGDAATLQQLGETFGLHPLTNEDIVNVTQRPKIEDYGEYLYIVVSVLALNEQSGEVETRQLSLVLAKNWLLSFEEEPSRLFDPVVTSLATGKGRARRAGLDYLAYRLIDVIVDRYFGVVESIGNRIEQLEDQVIDKAGPGTLHEISRLKHNLLAVRRAVWPLRELLGAMQRGDNALVSPESRVYVRDVYDHTISVIEMVESSRDILSDLHDLYLSSLNHKMNEVMKLLTVIATLFMPMTFVASIYGMNFKTMPELDKPWGYPLALLLMAGMAGGLWWYFRRKGWV